MATSMASPIGSKLAKTFKIGKKQVFLPAHKVAFIAPRENDPPNFATFQVPLTFNKFDMRDYLLHVYGTSVISVRSAIKQHRIEQDEFTKRYRRPMPTKYMIAVLKEPFVWPSAPEDTKPWKSKQSDARDKQQKDYDWRMSSMQKGYILGPSEVPVPQADRMLRAEAEKLQQEGGWSNKMELDPRVEQLNRKLAGTRLRKAKKN